MTAPTNGACCVCGKKTTQRCGACAKAGFDLFFCSTEHQRLVWFAHKLVCGPKSKPFAFPLLSEEEPRDALTCADMPYRVSRVRTVTLASTVHDRLNSEGSPLAKEPFSKLLASLRADQPPPIPLPLDLRHHLLCQVRVSLHALAMDRLPSTLTPLGMVHRPEDVPLSHFNPLFRNAELAFIIHRDLQDVGLPQYPASTDWYGKVLHQALIISALRHCRHKERLRLPCFSKPSPPPEVEDILTYCIAACQPVLDMMDEIKEATRVSNAAVAVLDFVREGWNTVRASSNPQMV